MNREEIHELITDISERILKLNENLAQARRILPVELDLLKSYQAELERLIRQLGNEGRVAALDKGTFTETSPAPRAEQATQQAREQQETETQDFNVEVDEPETGAEPRVPLQVEDTHETDQPVETPQPAQPQEEILDDLPEAPETETPAFEFNVEQQETGAEPRVGMQLEEPEPETHEEVAATEPEVSEPEEQMTVAHASEEEVTMETGETDEPVQVDDKADALPEEPIQVAHAEEDKITVETDKTNKPKSLVSDEDEDEEDAGTATKDAAKKVSLNERFKKEEPDLGYRVRPHAGTKNLRDMIDLSEKYVYARELFGGDTDYFERTLRYLNQCNTYHEAQNYVDNELRGKFNWAQKQPIEQRFTKLLKAKFEN